MENDAYLDSLKAWADRLKECIVSFRKARDGCEKKLDGLKMRQQEEVF